MAVTEAIWQAKTRCKCCAVRASLGACCAPGCRRRAHERHICAGERPARCLRLTIPAHGGARPRPRRATLANCPRDRGTRGVRDLAGGEGAAAAIGFVTLANPIAFQLVIRVARTASVPNHGLDQRGAPCFGNYACDQSSKHRSRKAAHT